MIYILDTADLEDIKHCNEYYPLAGVTTNPSIISKENVDFWPLLKEIRDIIGYDKMLHVQTVQKTAAKIVEEAKLLTTLIPDKLSSTLALISPILCLFLLKAFFILRLK